MARARNGNPVRSLHVYTRYVLAPWLLVLVSRASRNFIRPRMRIWQVGGGNPRAEKYVCALSTGFRAPEIMR